MNIFITDLQTPNMTMVRVAHSDSHLTLYVVHERAMPVLRGPNSTEPNLLHLDGLVGLDGLDDCLNMLYRADGVDGPQEMGRN